MVLEIDYMEYSTDVLARAAYVSNEATGASLIPIMVSNIAPSGEASAYSDYGGMFPAWLAMNGTNINEYDNWVSDAAPSVETPQWLQYDFGLGVTKVVNKYSVSNRNYITQVNRACPKSWTLQGSNNNIAWDILHTVTDDTEFGQAVVRTFIFANTTAYRYYRISFTDRDGTDPYVCVGEFKLFYSLIIYSEAVIKTQGDYSLKGVVPQTTSLNVTLTKTFGNVLVGGTSLADSEYAAGYEADKGCDGNLATYWLSANSVYPHWWRYDLGAGSEKIIRGLRFYQVVDVNGGALIKDYKIQGSNDGSNFTDLYTGVAADLPTPGAGYFAEWQECFFANVVSYRYYRFYITTAYRTLDNITGCMEFQAYEGLTDRSSAQFDLRASRTGSNIKVGLDSHVAKYPANQNGTYVKSTTQYDTDFYPWYATDPTKSVTGSWNVNGWVAVFGTTTNQRFHIDLGPGNAKIIRRIYYENGHASGTNGNSGVQHFTLWGSNEATAFAELTYAVDTDWNLLTTSQATFDQHPDADIAVPKYIEVTNSVAYRYYAFKFADNWGGTYLAIRRVELLTGALIEVTPNILSANTWQTTRINIADLVNKGDDIIAKIIITVVNADVTNTFYLDNFKESSVISPMVSSHRS